MNNEDESNTEILALHRKLAGEKLRADQGWARYEEANRDRNELRMSIVDLTESEESWRRLALQFDAHRMEALWHLKSMLLAASKHSHVVRAFLAAPPLSGEEVLAKRISELINLTDEQITNVWNSMPGQPDGWLKQFGYRQFARTLLETLRKNTK